MKLIVVGASASLILAQTALAIPYPAREALDLSNLERRNPTPDMRLTQRDYEEIARKRAQHRFEAETREEVIIRDGAHDEIKIQLQRRDGGEVKKHGNNLMDEIKDFFQSLCESIKGVILIGDSRKVHKEESDSEGKKHHLHHHDSEAHAHAHVHDLLKSDEAKKHPDVKIVITTGAGHEASATKTKTPDTTKPGDAPATTDPAAASDPSKTETKDTSAGAAAPGAPAVPAPTGTPAPAAAPKAEAASTPASSDASASNPPAPAPAPAAVSRRALADQLIAEYVAEGVIQAREIHQRRSMQDPVYNKAYEAAAAYKKIARRALGGVEDF